MPSKRESNFKPLSGPERGVCERLAERRRASGLTQDEFAESVLLTRAQLANIESMRVPLRFWPGWRACAKLNINQRWLATGELPSRPFFDLDLKRHHLNIAETALFNDVCTGRLQTDLEMRSELAWTIGQYQASGDALLKGYSEVLIEMVMVFLSKIPEPERAGALQSLNSRLIVVHGYDPRTGRRIKDKGRRQIVKIDMGESEEKPAVSFSNEKEVDDMVTSSDSPSMKAQWPGLLERLKRATAKRGVASALARELRVPLASVSRWLAGKREPSGDIALKLLRWVERQETK